MTSSKLHYFVARQIKKSVHTNPLSDAGRIFYTREELVNVM